MSHPSSGPSSRPTSFDPNRQSLSIRTSMPPSQPNVQLSPSRLPQQQQQLPHLVYPLAISPKILADKKSLNKAVDLLQKLRLQEGLEKRSRNTQAYSTLGVPTPASASSEPHSPSGNTSNYGGATESLVSFDENESALSAVVTADPISFDGRRIRQHRRSQLPPVAKAKAALIRYLGSCSVCRARRVKCPLEHHDIATLERLLRSRPRSVTAPEQARPVLQDLSQRHVSTGTIVRPPPTFGDAFAIAGLDENPALQTPIQQPVMDPHSSTNAEDLLSDIKIPVPDFSGFDGFDGLDDTITVPRFNTHDPYSSYQNGQMFELGAEIGWGYICRHAGGCQQTFPDTESLQIHFETHFAYNRMLPPDRYICLSCGNPDSDYSGVCMFCPGNVLFEHQIYGTFIRNQFYQRYSPDGHDLYGRNQAEPYAAFFAMPNPQNNTNAMGPSPGNSGNSSMNQGGYFQNSNNTFQTQGPNSGSESHGNNFDNYNTSNSGAFRFHGSQFGDVVEKTPVRYWFGRTIQACRRHKLFFLAVALLFTATFIVKTHDWFIAKAQDVELEPNLLIIAGFIGLIASFICYTFWTKHSARGRSHWVSEYTIPALSTQLLTTNQRYTKFPINDISNSAQFFRCAPTTPPPRMRGAIYL